MEVEKNGQTDVGAIIGQFESKKNKEQLFTYK